MLLTFSVVDTSSKVVINQLRLQKKLCQSRCIFTSENVNISSIVEILAGCSASSLTSLDQSYLDIIVLNDLEMTYKPLMIHVAVR